MDRPAIRTSSPETIITAITVRLGTPGMAVTAGELTVATGEETATSL